MRFLKLFSGKNEVSFLQWQVKEWLGVWIKDKGFHATTIVDCKPIDRWWLPYQIEFLHKSIKLCVHWRQKNGWVCVTLRVLLKWEISQLYFLYWIKFQIFENGFKSKLHCLHLKDKSIW